MLKKILQSLINLVKGFKGKKNNPEPFKGYSILQEVEFLKEHLLKPH